ncbi:MASE1 domain-containing protein [Candidatus Gottesmanbacteria bacterium]|nr:MASE1 domain-containing protein [Candidatus Gottesmanbacteria bacterium]
MKKTVSSQTRFILLSLGLILCYFILGKTGLSFASINPSASAIWPPTGFAIAVLLLYGIRLWPVVFIGAFLVNITTSGTWATASGIALGNTLEAIAAALLVNKYAGGIHAFERPLNTVRLAFLAGVVATIISASIGTATLLLSGLTTPDQLINIWITWWMGDMGGAIIFTPLILLWHTSPRVSIKPFKAIEYMLLMIFLGFICYLLFITNFPHPYLFILPLIWAAFRFELRETATLLAIVMSVTTYATTHGRGPFFTHAMSVNEALLQLQIFMVIVGVTKLTVAAAVEDNKRIDQKLFAKERRFQALIEKNTDAVVLIDPGAVITYASPSTLTVLGYTSDEVTGKNGFSFIHEEDIPRAKDDLKKVVLHPNDPVIGNYRMRRKDGSWVWIETIGRNLLFDPAVQALVINFRDVTDRKKLEEAKDDFLMTAAHQLRAPLTAMRWNIESLFGHDIPKEFRTKLEQMYERNKQMIKAVNEVLDIAHIIQGKLPNNAEKTDIMMLINNQINEYAQFAKRRNITINLTGDTGSMWAIVDPKHFNDALGNLLSNAVKYSYDRSTVTVDIARVKNTATISISDSGIGIPKNEQGKMFTKFYRATNAKVADAQGNGLGLFIVKSYTEGWGGKVTLESPVIQDQGTKISITIPLIKGGT